MRQISMPKASARRAMAVPIRPRPTNTSSAADLARERIRPGRPASFTDKAIGAVDLPRRRHQQAQRQIGHLVGEHIRRMRHFVLLRPCGGHIHAIVANAAHRNQAQIGQLRDYFFTTDSPFATIARVPGATARSFSGSGLGPRSSTRRRRRRRRLFRR